MGRMYYEHSAVFRQAVEECEAVFQELYGISPLTYLLHDGDLVLLMGAGDIGQASARLLAAKDAP